MNNIDYRDRELAGLRIDLAAKDATIAAQAAEIERLKAELKTSDVMRDHFERVSHDMFDVTSGQDAELDALRSQLEERRARLEHATEPNH